MANFLNALHSGRVLLMDGAMGTELRRAGLKDDECGELWNLTQPEKVRAIHQAYVDAGAEVLLSNTFQANRRALAKHDLENRSQEIIQTATALAHTAAGPNRFVILDMGPPETPISTGKVIWEWLNGLIPQACTADAILLETFSGSEAFPAVSLCRLTFAIKIPLLVSLTYRRLATGELCTHDRRTPEWFAMRARAFKVAALGVNCGQEIGMDEIIEIIRRYRKVTDLPLFARPNAGTPTRVGDRWVYPRTPEQMAERLPELLEAGVTMVGGCCGTTPEHIAAFKPIIDEWRAKEQSDSQDNGAKT